jgi:thiamine biosynthesis protein ThiI
VTVEVEVVDKRAQFFSQRHLGPGGLPLGTGGNALALLSGGYDSSVAAWQLMRRGVEVDFVHFRLGDHRSEETALGVAKVLSDAWGAGSRPEAHVIDLRGAMDEMRENVTPNLWQVSLKRLMVRAADGVADALEQRAVTAAADPDVNPREASRQRARRRIDALVTGEAIGQVSSQTLSNLRTIDDAAERPVLRPLIGFDKLDIIAVAERIGTASLSAGAIEECNITPVRPATSSRPERLAREEAGMAGGALEVELGRVRRGDSRLPLRSLRPGEGFLEEVFEAFTDSPFGALKVTEVPAGAVLLDCRNEMLRRWRPDWPNIRVVPVGVVSPDGYDKAVTYVAFCPQGMRSAAVAEKLREGGVRAYSFAGGEGAMKAYFEAVRAGEVS